MRTDENMRHKYFEVEENDQTASEQVKPKDCKVQVIAKLLNVRKGPGKTFNPAGILTEHQIVELSDVSDGFGKIKNTETWIDMHYVKIIE